MPPSSIDRRIKFLAALPISRRPTSVDPVNESLRTRSSSKNASPIVAASPVTMFTTPAGMPASTASSPIAIADKGVSSAGLITTVHPHASTARACA